ncbi:MAG: MotA/TolQ/ExbB proton channel family protein [Akkermansiaceae bacterium]
MASSDSPYQSPKTETPVVATDGITEAKRKQKRAFWKKGIWFGIAGILAPIVLGVLGMVVGMMEAFSTLSSSDGSADPEALAGNISSSILSILYGSAFSFIAFIFLIIAIAKFRKYKAPTAP